jgi:hypothetical protein
MKSALVNKCLLGGCIPMALNRFIATSPVCTFK